MNQPADHVHKSGLAAAPMDHAVITVVERPLPLWERVWNRAAVRQGLVVVLLAIAWEISGRWSDDLLLFPSFSDTLKAFWTDLSNGVLPVCMLRSLHVLVLGYAVGTVCAVLLTAVTATSRLGSDLLLVLTTILGPLPAIALLPLAFLWFGMGEASLVFVLVCSVLRPLAFNTHSGFQEIPDTLRMAGRNYGLRPDQYMFLLLLPAAFPSILTGLRVGWAFAWRTLIAAELVFGVAAGSGGIGWYIYENHVQRETPRVFAGLLSVIVIGLLVEGCFRVVEGCTIRRWGMQR